MSEEHKHTLVTILLDIASLLEPSTSGCRTVEDLLATDMFTRKGEGEFDMERLLPSGKALLADLRTLDYVALRNLAAAVADPWVVLDVHSELGPYT